MRKGKLTIFVSYTPGAGKSFLMISKAMEQKRQGAIVEIGFINSTHRDIGKLITDNMLDFPGERKYSLSQIIRKQPELVVMDELGMHDLNIDQKTFVYEDVEELLKRGIDVYTSANIKKFEGFNKAFKDITGIGIRKTIPDKFLDMAEKIFFVDRTPENMITDFHGRKLFEEKYYNSKIMKKNFQKDTLEAYRRVAMNCMEPYREKLEYVLRK